MDFFKEEFYDIATKDGKDKNQWVDISTPKLYPISKKDEKLKYNLFDLVNDAYMTALQMPHVGIKSVADVFKDKYDYWEAIDLDEHPDAEVVIFGTRKNGIKISGIGHDGQPISKSILMRKKVELLNTKGYWQEASRKPAEILKHKGVPVVSDFKIIYKLIPKDKIVQTFSDGSYIRLRDDGSHSDREYLFGKPLV